MQYARVIEALREVKYVSAETEAEEYITAVVDGLANMLRLLDRMHDENRQERKRKAQDARALPTPQPVPRTFGQFTLPKPIAPEAPEAPEMIWPKPIPPMPVPPVPQTREDKNADKHRIACEIEAMELSRDDQCRLWRDRTGLSTAAFDRARKRKASSPPD